MCLWRSCVALLSFWAFYDSSNALQIDVFFSIAIVPSSFRFTLHFSFTPSFYRFPSLSRAFFLPHFFPSVRNPRSFIYFLLRLFSPNRPGAVRMSVKYHPCEMGCAAASFSRSSYTAISHDFALRARLTNENWRCEMKRNRRKSSCWEKLMERLSLDYL